MEIKNGISEGLARIHLENGVFFNPEMELCRDVSSLAVGTLGEKLSVCDGCCASGVRGIRYKLENRNIARVEFVDLSEKACKLAKKNIRANKLRACSVHCEDLNLFLYKKNFDLLEIDPFGSPVPYLYAALRSFARVREGVLSVTATDMAVLCGAHPSACLKNYQARPIDNEFCHEIAARILLGKVARTASEFNLGIEPLLTFSHQHFIKIFVRVRKGAKYAVESMRALGYVSYCGACLNREARKGVVVREMCACGKKFDFAGPLWLGKLEDAGFVRKMEKLNAARAYRNKRKIASLLALIREEAEMPPTYFDMHKICEKMKCTPPKLESAIARLRERGFRVTKTHFRENCVRTDADVKEVKKAVGKSI